MLLEKKYPLFYILNKIKYEFVYISVLSFIVYVIKINYIHLLPEVPIAIPAFMGTAISILLSFKIGQSYDRWWEARKIWGSIVNDSRSFMIQLKIYLSDSNEKLIEKMALRQIAWCYSLAQSLRGLNPLQFAEKYLTNEDVKEIKQHNNQPLALLNLHGQDLKELKSKGEIDTFTLIQLDNSLIRFCESQGKAERIKTTVFPVTYRLFLHLIIYAFVITLSISLQDIGLQFEFPLLLLISLLFFLLEKTASHLQDPFENRPSDTAMLAISRTIEINLKQILKQSEIPQPLPKDNFYLL